ncbi:MAG TPA: hypothetical protein VNG51_18005 [Ktedonobacteraceae bacterium]|nr:hypothetical protein [Ktedonobacteraceae bacterium]
MIMSAFIVEDKTINKVVTWFRREVYTQSFTLNELAKKYHINLISDVWDEPLAKAMFQLNCAGVDARYGNGTAKKDVTIPFQFQPVAYETEVQVFKALQCWLYQCSEGDVPETKLYKFFSEIENYLARKIVMALPEYDQTTWG